MNPSCTYIFIIFKVLNWEEYTGFCARRKEDEEKDGEDDDDKSKEEEEEEEVLEYGSLVGHRCVSRMLLYRAN